MAKFTDELKREWTVAINGAVVIRCKRELGVNLPGIFVGQSAGLHELLQDFEKLVDVLWICCEEQARQQQIDTMSFARGLGGDALEAATHALIDGLLDFFPNAAQRQAWRAAIRKSRKLVDELLKVAEQAIEDSPPRMPTGNSSSWPESSEWLQSHAPIGS